MTEAIQKSLRESAAARWTALGILSFTMFAGYLFTEIISPMKPIIERVYGWDGSDFGMFFSAYGWFNVFFLALIFVGILLDKFGIRFSTLASVLTMIAGAFLKYLAFSMDFGGSTIAGFDTQLLLASIGYALFGVGVEYAGITVSKSIVKWFRGKEIALAMGMQVAIARLGSFVPLAFGAAIATALSVPTAVLFGVLFLIIGFFGFIIYNIMDRKLEKQDKDASDGLEEEDKFKLTDLKVIISNRGFWLIAILCVLFYSAVFPFYKYGPDLMVNKFGVSDKWSGLIPSIVPFGTIFLTPFFGSIYDKKGKGASIMILGAVMLILVHFIYYLPALTSVTLAFVNAIILGIAFSLVPSAMWPSVPKIIPEKQIGSAYAFIFWIQNFGLWGIPLLIGVVLEKTNPGVAVKIQEIMSNLRAQNLSDDQIDEQVKALKEAGQYPIYNYETTWMIFVGLTILALIVAFMLKAEDKKKGYGLELPNIADKS
ncbi:MAG: MFS transporter [Bacteroidales bacterium]|nr:MFS transporter [Bacteroidales bacterium]